MSKPIVVIVCMLSSSESWEPQTTPTSLALTCRWRSRPQHQLRPNAPQQRAPVFDHLVGKREQPGTSRPSVFAVLRFNQLVFRRWMTGKSAVLSNSKDTENIVPGLAVHVGD